MKNIRIFRSKKEYQEFLAKEIFTQPLIANHEFYKNLVQFVVDHKAPLFYQQSDPMELDSFSSYCHFQPIRNWYDNYTLRTMFFLHDFVHMLFYYPYDMSSVTREEFNEIMILGEYAASDETEILIHYRIPELRERIFPDRRIFFDILKERVSTPPPPRSLFKLRQALIETSDMDPFFFTTKEDALVSAWFKKFKGNPKWCETRYLESLKVQNAGKFLYRSLTPHNYERVIKNYQSEGGETEYQKLITMNVQLAFAIVGLENSPTVFEECFEKIKLLEGKVMFKPGNLEQPKGGKPCRILGQ